MTRRVVTFGDMTSRGVSFVFDVAHHSPGEDECRAVVGTWEVVLDGRRWELQSGNGIEAQGLSMLRSDLRQLEVQRSGGLYVQDHDSSLSVNLWADGGVVLGWATAPGGASWSPDMGDGVWDEPLAPMSFEHLVAMASIIDEVEAEVGPLTGYCCGPLAPTWPSHDPRRHL